MLYLERSFYFDYFTRYEVNSLSCADLLSRLIGSSVTTLSRETQGCSDENHGADSTDVTISHSMSIIDDSSTFGINDGRTALKACYVDHNATFRTWHQEHVYCRMHDWFSSWCRSARYIRDRAMGFIKGTKLGSKGINYFSSKQSTRNVGSHYSSKDISDVPTLNNMPEEIVSEIMKQLSPLSLWSFRQASPVHFRIFDSKDFNEYQGELGLRERRPCFHVGKLSVGERAEASGQLRRDQSGCVEAPMYCESCVEVNNRGDGDPRLVSMRKLRFCEACGENHSGVFFPAQDLEAYDAGAKQLNCLGTTGSWQICGHGVTTPVTWHTIARQMASETGKTKQFCKHPAHQYIQPKIKRPMFDCVVSAKPRLHMSHGYSMAVKLSFGWDLALFDIDTKSMPSLMQVRNAILGALEGNLLDNLTCCQHVLRQGKLRKFARDGICRCFIKPGNTNYPDTEYGPKDFRCDCKRVQVLDCETCSGAFAWQLISGRIFLSYRYHWNIRRPTSPPWMALLDDITEEIYTAHNKHLLWCDQPGCANVYRTRWMDLIKEEACLQYFRFATGQKDKETKKIEDDYRTMKLRNTGCGGCYKVPLTRNPAGCDIGASES